MQRFLRGLAILDLRFEIHLYMLEMTATRTNLKSNHKSFTIELRK